MIWYVLFFLVILKIPSVYLGYMIWWSVKDPPNPASGGGGGLTFDGGDSGGGPGPRRASRARRRGPHGSPVRRPLRGAPARAGTRERS